MDAHAHAEQAHPTASLYVKVGVLLFVLTALEVGLYEITYGEHAGAMGSSLQPFFVPLLLLMSAAKFALVAMFYMHLKQDHPLFTGVFVFPLIIATIIIVALIVLFAYHYAFATFGRLMHLPFAPLLDERPRPTTPYEWSWALHPSVLIGTGLLGALYFWGIGPMRRRLGLGPPAAPWQIASFCAALVVLLVSLNGPMHDLSDYYLFSVHMVQHLVLTLVFPPLLLAGIPSWLLTPILRHEPVRRVLRRLTHPVVAAVLYSVTIAAWHVSPGVRPHDARSRRAHRDPPHVHGRGHADVVARDEPFARAAPTVARRRDALSLPGGDSDADRGRAHHFEQRRTLPLVLGRAADLGTLAAR